MSAVERLKQERIVAIFRGIPEEGADRAAEAIVQGGVRLIEATMNSKGVLGMIRRWRDTFGSEAMVGAGTVLDVELAKQAVDAGAQFLISPNLDEEVIAFAVRQQVDVFPGCMTPTEIVRAVKAGAKVVKVFPTGALGLSFIKELQGPLGHIPMMASGGVSESNIGEFLKAGAMGVGLGGNLVDKVAVQEGRFNHIRKTAERFVQIVKGE